MNKFIILILIFLCPVFGFSMTYYVTPSGNNANNGVTEANAWGTIAYAAQTAVAGDIVYVKAGNYGDENVEFANGGTAGNPITFCGYQTVPGDIGTDAKNYYTAGDPLNSSVMPTLCGSDRTVRRGIDFKRKSYITLKNFQVKHYTTGIHTEGDSEYLIIDNCIVIEIGAEIEPATPTGFGICIYGDNNTVQNSIVTDAGDMNISIYGNNNLVENCETFGISDDNQIGYHILVEDGNFNTVRNCVIRNLNPLDPVSGNGIGTRGGQNNQFQNCEAYGANFSFYGRWVGAAFNTFTDCIAYNGNGFIIREGSHDNNFIRCRSVNCIMATRFLDSVERLQNDPCAYNNTFTNCIFESTIGVAFNILNSAYPDSDVINNKFVNCTFTGSTTSGAPSIFSDEMPSSGNQIINCTFSDFDNFIQGVVPINPIGFTYRNSNFFNVTDNFPVGSDTMDMLHLDPLFVDVPNGDFRLQDVSPLIGAGTATCAPNTDFAGTARPLAGTFEIGAFESFFGSALVPTLSEWGLIILALLILNIGVLYAQVPKLALASSNKSISIFSKIPFQKAHFFKKLLLVSIAIFLVFLIGVVFFNYEFTTADPFGILITVPLLAMLFCQLGTSKS